MSNYQITSPPILSYPRPGCQFIVDSDASDKAVGAVLSQVQEGTEKVIAYMSKALNQHEQMYCVTRKPLSVAAFVGEQIRVVLKMPMTSLTGLSMGPERTEVTGVLIVVDRGIYATATAILTEK
jgi:hypothetical protein